jgi:hypothetical protein
MDALKQVVTRGRAADPGTTTQPALQGTGCVLLSSAGRFVLQVGAEKVPARRAASCLLLPAAGDLVAWCRGTGDELFIYAVLVRATESVHELCVEGDASLQVSGTLRLEAARAVSIRSARVESDSEELQLKARTATVLVGTLEAVADLCRTTLNQLKLIGGQVTSVFERVSVFAKHHQRVVEGVDLVEAHVLDYRGKSLVQLRGENVLTNGERLVKTRGGQIHLG